MPTKSKPKPTSAVAEHRRRLRGRGLRRVEVQVRGEDAPLVRAVAAALADPARAAAAARAAARALRPDARAQPEGPPRLGAPRRRRARALPRHRARRRPVTWLVDTNVISEVRKGPRCHPGVAA